MIAATGLGSVLLGTALACLASFVPRHIAAIETAGGVLVIGGLVAIGSQLAAFHL